MADFLPALPISSPRSGSAALLTGPERARLAKILVVEDQAELQRALRIDLRARVYEVMGAGTGRDALAASVSWLPDAVILDLSLPDIGGIDVLVELRRWYRRPIIVLSGRTSPGDKVAALDAGADDYVTKPFGMGSCWPGYAALRRDEGFQQRTNYLRFHMAQLRRKLEDDPARPHHLLTEHGMGYRFQP